jgi:hypothetical protein
VVAVLEFDREGGRRPQRVADREQQCRRDPARGREQVPCRGADGKDEQEDAAGEEDGKARNLPTGVVLVIRRDLACAAPGAAAVEDCGDDEAADERDARPCSRLR